MRTACTLASESLWGPVRNELTLFPKLWVLFKDVGQLCPQMSLGNFSHLPPGPALYFPISLCYGEGD